MVVDSAWRPTLMNMCDCNSNCMMYIVAHARVASYLFDLWVLAAK